MEALLPLIVQLIGGGAGGNIIAQVVKKVDLGPAGNSIVGAVGGIAGTWLAGQIPGLDGLVGNVVATADATGATTGGLDIGALAGQGITGLVSGGILTAIAGLIKSSMAKA
ncbi:hypothetical protein PSQ19_08680 [Devosia algicola]|uniref:DNA methyltransferase n=1 Tax=Devosia algicola TaxID=3026418 RepID=A0ABY7YSB2_9HYPH|nr:hypothetical protein [Devosia algicola]WDR04067.1 hypothetical protein PSQ19_08680 [Devosia algicola]